MATQSRGLQYRFGEFTFDARGLELRRDGETVELQNQPARALALLLESAGDLVRRETLREELWSDDVHIEFDQSLNACIRRLRAALDDDPRDPVYVETRPRRGYRFVAPVEIVGGSKQEIRSGGSEAGASPRWPSLRASASRRVGGSLVGAAVAVALVLAVVALVEPASTVPRLVLEPFGADGVSPRMREVVHDEIALALVRLLDGDMVLVLHEPGEVDSRAQSAGYVVEGEVIAVPGGVRLQVRLLAEPEGRVAWSGVYDGRVTGEHWDSFAERAATHIVGQIEER